MLTTTMMMTWKRKQRNRSKRKKTADVSSWYIKSKQPEIVKFLQKLQENKKDKLEINTKENWKEIYEFWNTVYKDLEYFLLKIKMVHVYLLECLWMFGSKTIFYPLTNLEYIFLYIHQIASTSVRRSTNPLKLLKYSIIFL